MIKFFRKIRQRLLAENKFSRYLLYAVGEIFLVVIGILIALQINNWNEGLKERATEQSILKQLHSEYQSNLAQLDEKIFMRNEALGEASVFLVPVGPLGASDGTYHFEAVFNRQLASA